MVDYRIQQQIAVNIVCLTGRRSFSPFVAVGYACIIHDNNARRTIKICCYVVRGSYVLKLGTFRIICYKIVRDAEISGNVVKAPHAFFGFLFYLPCEIVKHFEYFVRLVLYIGSRCFYFPFVLRPRNVFSCFWRPRQSDASVIFHT